MTGLFHLQKLCCQLTGGHSEAIREFIDGSTVTNRLKQRLLRSALLGDEWSSTELMEQFLGSQQGCRLILQQGIAAATGPTTGISGNSPNGALLLRGKSCRDQRTTALRAFHNHKGSSKEHQQPVSGREVSRLHRTARRMLAQQKPPPPHGHLQWLVMRWINTIQRRAQHRDRSTIDGKTTAMRCRVNPLSEATQHWPASSCQCLTEFVGHGQAVFRCRSGANYCDGLALLQQVPQILSPLMMQHRGRPMETIQTLRPVQISWQQCIAGNSQIRALTLEPPVTIHTIRTRARPGELVPEPLGRPPPELIRSNPLRNSQAPQRCDPNSTQTRTSDPQPPPATHSLLSTEVLV